MTKTTASLAELKRTFVAPSGLESSRPRPVRLTMAGRFLAGFAVFLFGAAIVLGVVLTRQARRDAARAQTLAESGVMTGGTVTWLGRDGDDRTRVRYRFLVDGRTYNAEGRVSSARRRELVVGSSIDVRYVPDDPRLNNLGTSRRGGLPIGIPILVAAVLGLPGVAMLLGIGAERRLLSEGRVAPGIVTGKQKRHSSHGGTHESMTYDFPLLTGLVASGKSSTSKPPAVGTIVCVVYDPERPARNRVYPFSLVRAGASF